MTGLALPPGYTLDQPPAATGLAPPEGYTLDAPSGKGDRLPMAPGAVLHDMPADTVSRDVPLITPGGSDIGASIGSQVAAGVLDLPGIPGEVVDLADTLVKAAGRGTAQLLGASDETMQKLRADQAARGRPLSWVPRTQDVKDFVGFKPYEPQTAAGKIFDKYVGPGIEILPSLGGGLLRAGTKALVEQGGKAAVKKVTGDVLKQAIAPAAAGEVAGDVTKGTPFEPWARLGATVLTAMVGGRSGGKPKPGAAPTVSELHDESQALYKASKQQGVSIKPAVLDQAIADVTKKAASFGIDPTIHPDSFAALKRMQQFSGIAPVNGIKTVASLEDLDMMRQLLGDAAKSTKPADAMRAGMMKDEFERFMKGLKPADVLSKGDPRDAVNMLFKAISLWSRKSKGEVIGELFHRAELKAPNFSGSGAENAVRSEFRALSLNQKKMRQFSPAERAAIEAVATGKGALGKLSVGNLMRMIGKAAPTGIVSAGIGSGAGLAAGGPVGALAVPAVGLAARKAATVSTMRKARAAEDLVLRGGKVIKPPRRPTPFPQLPILYGAAAQRSTDQPK